MMTNQERYSATRNVFALGDDDSGGHFILPGMVYGRFAKRK